MVDCRSLIEFCRAFQQHRDASDSSAIVDNPRNNRSRSKKQSKSLNPLSHPFCDHSPFAAIDVIIFLFVLGAIGILTFPYFKFMFVEAFELLSEAFSLAKDVMYEAPVAYVIGLLLMLVTVIAVWEFFYREFRKCGNPYCKGLRKAVDIDIQLETEDFVKFLPTVPKDVYGTRPLELGQNHKELEAELKKMAPLNGRTVLIFRQPCGCPTGRLEVWGPKKPRKIKK